jgi:hypothetical protein
MEDWSGEERWMEGKSLEDVASAAKRCPSTRRVMHAGSRRREKPMDAQYGP